MPEQVRFVRCKVSLGFFDTEFYVVIGDSSVFVDRQNVTITKMPERGSETEGEVRAYLVTEAKDRALIELPGEPVVGGLRTWIPKSLFSTAK
jgi:hypothetical protein